MINNYIISVNSVVKTQQPVEIIISESWQVERCDKNEFHRSWPAVPLICMILVDENRRRWINLGFGGSTSRDGQHDVMILLFIEGRVFGRITKSCNNCLSVQFLRLAAQWARTQI